MKFIAPLEINSIIGLIYTGGRVNYINDRELSSNEEYALDFGDFIKSQLDNKIIECDFKSLICCTVHIRDNLKHGEKITEQMHQNISRVFLEFIKVGTLAAIYLHMKHGIRLNLTITKELKDYIVEDLEGTVEGILAFQTNSVISDTNSYEEILHDNDLIIMSYGELDFNYLTRMLIAYNYCQEGVCAIWEGGVC